MRHQVSHLQGCGRTDLFTQEWLPDYAANRHVVIAHGLAEHSSRYWPLAERLVAKDWGVHALDHRGHGASAGSRANVGRFEYLVRDLDTFIERVRSDHPGGRLVLLGHSMGGAIALEYALRYQSRLHGLVLSAPAVGVGRSVPLPRIVLARLLSWIMPNLGVLTLPSGALSRDPAVVRAYEEDPLVYRRPLPARTLSEWLRVLPGFRARAGELHLPVLILHGTGDRLVALADTRPVYDRISESSVTLKVYEDLYHEVLNEPEREQVIGDLEAWLENVMNQQVVTAG